MPEWLTWSLEFVFVVLVMSTLLGGSIFGVRQLLSALRQDSDRLPGVKATTPSARQLAVFFILVGVIIVIGFVWKAIR